jgi:hypothetical protein
LRDAAKLIAAQLDDGKLPLQGAVEALPEPNITLFSLSGFHKADVGFAIEIDGGQLQA